MEEFKGVYPYAKIRAPPFIKLNATGEAIVQCTFWFHGIEKSDVKFNVTAGDVLADYTVEDKDTFALMMVSKEEMIKIIGENGTDVYDSWTAKATAKTIMKVVTLKSAVADTEYFCNFFYPDYYDAKPLELSAKFIVKAMDDSIPTSSLVRTDSPLNWYDARLYHWNVQTTADDTKVNIDVLDDWAKYSLPSYIFHGLNDEVDIIFFMESLESTNVLTHQRSGQSAWGPALNITVTSSGQVSQVISVYGEMRGVYYSDSDALLNVIIGMSMIPVLAIAFIVVGIAAAIRSKTSSCCRRN